MELEELDELAVKLGAVEKSIESYGTRLVEVEKDLTEYRHKSEVERHFHQLSGLPYEDKSAELEEQMKTLKGEYESALSQRDKLREDIVKGLSDVLIPLEKDSATISQREVDFAFRDGREHPNIVSFIENKLDFGHPPVYVIFSPNGVKVVGVGNEVSAMQEVIKAIESLRARAKEELKPNLKRKNSTDEKTPSKGKFLDILKR